jgi:hypothetical protein
MDASLVEPSEPTARANAAESRLADDSGAPEQVPLVTAQSWSQVPTADDPFQSWAETDVDCNSLAAFYPEDAALELDTGRCNFVTVEQSLPVALPQGAELQVELVHYDLVAPEPATARAAIAFESAGDGPSDAGLVTSWEREVAIPAPADIIVESFSTNRSLSAGDRILFHLQNHGQNTWRLERVDWLRPD